jgi:hypothetical protein
MSNTVQDHTASSVVEVYEFGTLGGLIDCLSSLATTQLAEHLRSMRLEDATGRAIGKLKVCILHRNGELALEGIISAGEDFRDLP